MAKKILCKDCKHNQENKCECNKLVIVKNRQETITYNKLDKTDCEHYDI